MNKVCELLNIKYPIIQGGMVWVSGAKLAAASANAGCLGVLGAGSMKPELLKAQIKKAQSLSDKTLAVNIPLLYHGAQEQIQTALELGIKVFITSAGSPKKYTQYLKDQNAKVIHVCASPNLAKKCEDAGVDMVIAEGFEAGGHNGRDELTTMTLIPQVRDQIKIPLIAAGGIGDARGMLAAMCLGADAIQMGTRFLMTKESRAHQNYKDLLLSANESSTELSMKSLVPVRLYKNKFWSEIKALEEKCEGLESIKEHLGKGRAKLGMHDGDLDEGELEIGQVCSMIKDIPSTSEMIEKLMSDFNKLKADLYNF